MYKSFCLRQRRGDFDLSNRDQLWKLLVQITLRKARNTANRHLLAKRDVRRDASGNAAPPDGFDDPATLLNQLDMDEPTPAEAALLNEALEQRFKALREPALRLIAQKKLEGYTNEEIAQELQCTVRTVERKLAWIRTYWGKAED